MSNLFDSATRDGYVYNQPRPVKLDTPTQVRVCNAASTQRLQLSSVMSPSGVRPGCDDHRKHLSRGF